MMSGIHHFGASMVARPPRATFTLMLALLPMPASLAGAAVMAGGVPLHRPQRSVQDSRSHADREWS
jgi:hypothetical protein